MARPFKHDAKAIVRRYRRSRLTMAEVAAEIGCSKSTVRRALHRAGITADDTRKARR